MLAGGCTSSAFKFAMVALLALGVSAATAAAQTTFVSVGTGAISGQYYPAGRALCDLVNREQRAHGVRCQPSRRAARCTTWTRSGRANSTSLSCSPMCSTVPIRVEAIGRVPPTPACGPSCLSIQSWSPSWPARNSQVGEIDDLEDKWLDIGRPGSGAHATWEAIEAALWLDREDLSLPLSELILLLRPDARMKSMPACRSSDIVGLGLAQSVDECGLLLGENRLRGDRARRRSDRIIRGSAEDRAGVRRRKCGDADVRRQCHAGLPWWQLPSEVAMSRTSHRGIDQPGAEPPLCWAPGR